MMGAFLAKRLAQAVVVAFGALTPVFVIVRVRRAVESASKATTSRGALDGAHHGAGPVESGVSPMRATGRKEFSARPVTHAHVPEVRELRNRSAHCQPGCVRAGPVSLRTGKVPRHGPASVLQAMPSPRTEDGGHLRALGVPPSARAAATVEMSARTAKSAG